MGSLLLVAAYLGELERRLSSAAPTPTVGDRLGAPEIYFAGLFGILLVFWFSSRCIAGVTRSARRLIDEVRRQLRDRPQNGGKSDVRGRAPSGSTEGLARSGRAYVPDHETLVDMALRMSLREMLVPSLVATVAPVAVGLALRLARTEDNRAVAADSVAALVVAATIAGVLGSLLLGNAGGAWDNAKKYIVTGAHGGRYLVDETGSRVDNPTYSAALVGDAVGDPLKDTAGPALHVLAKMLNVISLVFLPFFL